MNAGTSLGWMADVISSITVLMPGGDSRVIQREDLKFAYRKLEWQTPEREDFPEKPIILEGRFCLQTAEPSKLKKEACEIMKARMRRQPMGLPSAGCFFKNPSSESPAGRLIEQAGLKGRRVGGAEISSKHANFIVNTGKAAAADILSLMEDVRESVAKMFNIDLESEVQIVGE
jgi:UDP-N-acetylmuramate dehydrogenase